MISYETQAGGGRQLQNLQILLTQPQFEISETNLMRGVAHIDLQRKYFWRPL